MELIQNFIAEHNIDLLQLAKAAGFLLVGTLLFSSIGRLAFGKKSTLNCAVSSAIGIIFIYCIFVVIQVFGGELSNLLTSLPFVAVSQDTLHLFPFSGAGYALVCTQLVGMIILAFLMNLIDGKMPTGKNIFTWLIFRCLTIILAIALYLLVDSLFYKYLPEGITTYAPTIVLGILALMLLTGALKLLVGVILTTVNPLIAAFYTFFFANFVGKQVTKAVLTTGILALIVLAMEYFGIFSFSIAPDMLLAYLPFALLLIPIWFLIGKVL